MSKTTVVKYGLLHKESNVLLGYYTSSNDGRDFCGDTSYTLSCSQGNRWLVDSPYQAEYVRQHSTEWYNAGYATPENEYKPEELEVVKVTVTTEVEAESVTIPTMKELLTLKYAETDPEHLAFALEDMKRYPDAFYTLYDLQELLTSKKWS